MNQPLRPPKKDSADFLLSWDRLGFRLLVFGGLALLWIVQARMLKQLPWSVLILGELTGLLPWAFLAPIVLSLGRRIQVGQLGVGGFLAAHFAGMILVFIPYWMIQRMVLLVWNSFASGWDPSRLTVLVPTLQNLIGGFLYVPIVYLLILLGAEAMQHARARQEEQLHAERVAGQLAEARLALLQRQLQPHFLFNALQAISTLLHRDPTMADGLLVRLSTLLRAMLENASGQTLSLGTELELTRKYLEIEQARFTDRLAVRWEVDPGLIEVQVPSLIVLPFVENAIRHGLSPKMGPGHLKISANADGSTLVLTVADDGLGTALPLGPGVGIGNSRERLASLYGDRASLEIDTGPERGFCARIRIPFPEDLP